jgi:hypothetical protein
LLLAGSGNAPAGKRQNSMKRRYAYRDGKVVELIRAPEVRHPSTWERLAVEGTAGERVLQGCKDWEAENGSKGFKYPARVYKEAWARDVRDNYGNQNDFKAFVASQNNQPDQD